MKDSELIITDGRIYHLGIKPSEIAKNIFLVGERKRVYRDDSYFDIIKGSYSNREYVIKTGLYRGVPVSVMSTGMGVGSTEIALVELFGLNEFDFNTRMRKDQTNNVEK